MTVVGFIGLGRMGLPMASNLLKAGFAVTGCDVDRGRTETLAARGARTATTPAEVARGVDISISIIMNDAILREVACGADGVLGAAAEGHTYVDLSTVSPAASAEVAAKARKRGVRYLCGKVAGSIGLAEEGSLTLFASGGREVFDRCEPVLAAMAAKVHHVGAGDSAAYLKLVHSLIVGVTSAMLGEALTFGQKGGLDLATMVDILEGGPLGSRQLTLKAPVLKERRFAQPPSDIDTAAKDVDMILDTARRDATPLPITAAVRQMMAAAQAQGGGKREIYAILETFERAAGLEVPR